jgi:tetratricopeptide (TPR) repeat protein
MVRTLPVFAAIVVFGSVSLGAGSVSLGAAIDDRPVCFAPISGDENIAACTRLIASGMARGRDLAQVYARRGMNYAVIKNDLDRALIDYDLAIPLDPQNAAFYALRGAILARQHNFDRALADLNESRRLKPEDPLLSNAFGVYYNEKGDYDRAIAELNESIRLSPQYAFAYRNRGISYERKGDLARSLADFRFALNLDPAGKTAAGREAAEGIQRVEQRLAAKAPANTPVTAPQISPPPVTAAAAADKGLCLAPAAGDENIAACTRLISSGVLSGPELAEAYARRATNYAVIKDDFDHAIADFNQAIAIDPRHATAYAIRGAIFAKRGSYDRALSDLNAARKLRPRDPIVSNAFGVYYNEMGDHDRAIRELNDAIRLWPQFSSAYRNRGVSYEQKGDAARALADFRVALSFDPNKKTSAGRDAAEGIQGSSRSLPPRRLPSRRSLHRRFLRRWSRRSRRWPAGELRL